MSAHKATRHRERTPNTATITYAVLDQDRECREFSNQEQTGILIDISSAGVGFITDAFLEPGSVIRLHLIDKHQAGVVMWTLNNDHQYRVGVRLIA